eukprot:jgi/Mesen1/4952/ME000247S04231
MERVAAELRQVAEDLGALGAELSRRRRVAALQLRSAVEAALRQLAMASTRFEIDVSWQRATPSPASLSLHRHYGSSSASRQHTPDTHRRPAGTLRAGHLTKLHESEEYEEEGGDEGKEEEEEDESEEEDDEGDLDERDDRSGRSSGRGGGGGGRSTAPLLLVEEGLLRTPHARAAGEDGAAFHQIGASGMDKVLFRLAANAGEPLLPLSQVASGGECARVMLALKSVPRAAEGGTPVCVFDEVDTGVGGPIGRAVGSSLRQLASSGLQVAVFADRHVKVAKRSATDGRMETTGLHLSDQQSREEEIAHMLGLDVAAAQQLFSSVDSSSPPLDDSRN